MKCEPFPCENICRKPNNSRMRKLTSPADILVKILPYSGSHRLGTALVANLDACFRITFY